ncbi:hypothetical protein JTE90_010686 [Oedothorax gibbosus]|uniref:Uncharacterized protein n=1 Tax=Oedothorax gibbosus TaxID=931172 RepID=A0AAV6UR50_9ARAC|nr:hypothetical protein JTE90_010686 [Oedothorax gibbosus]
MHEAPTQPNDTLVSYAASEAIRGHTSGEETTLMGSIIALLADRYFMTSVSELTSHNASVPSQSSQLLVLARTSSGEGCFTVGGPIAAFKSGPPGGAADKGPPC